ncbi:MAG: STAS domain-containing protein [Spirochaetia bacterium]|nr:STAS domain-containing protein [Spirochaetia bacterium]
MMEITHNLRKEAIEIIPEGMFNFNETDNFDAYINDTAINAKQSVIAINLEKVEYIDSTGLGSLIKALNEAKKKGKEFLIFGATIKIQNIFKIARLEKFFSFISPVEFKTKYPSDEDSEIDSFIESI